ncbi:MAG: nucleotidyl transferase AbiEii/AbiGii toxin family protein [Actinomycetota bacterium]|nr:nucleotidyl transferase AbiEii/AbiGii toxin family protein [Actinomycetota bacterium]
MRTHEQLIREAAAAGFAPEPYEKVAWLLELLAGLESHPYLRGRLALKGGTALNVFVFDLPRLSVDIDLNYVGAADRETMLAERPLVEQAVEAVCGRMGLQVRRVPSDHTGGKWRLSYTTTSGRPGTLELDLNFLLRTPLWPVRQMPAKWASGSAPLTYPVLDIHELAAGKLAALFGRTSGRDVYDTVRILESAQLDLERLRLGFVVYGAASRRDWCEIRVEDIATDPTEVARQVLPMLRGDARPAAGELDDWLSGLLARARVALESVLPLADHEAEFIRLVNEEGVLRAGLLTGDPGMQRIIEGHPALLWKAQNVRQYRAGDGVREGVR